MEGLTFAREESQRGGIHTITQAGRPRSVGKNVTKMGVAESAPYCGTQYSVGKIFLFADVFFGDRLEKTGPSGAGVKLGQGIKQRIVAIDTAIKAGAVLIVQRAGESPFGGGPAGDIKLQGGELSLPLRGGLLYFCGRRGAQRSTVVRKLYDFYRPGAGSWFHAIRKSGRTNPLHAHEHAVTAQRCRCVYEATPCKFPHGCWLENCSFRGENRHEAYFNAVIGGGATSGKRLGSPRAPRTSTSSKSSEGATIDAGNPFCAEPKAPRAVPANPFIWLCI